MLGNPKSVKVVPGRGQTPAVQEGKIQKLEQSRTEIGSVHSNPNSKSNRQFGRYELKKNWDSASWCVCVWGMFEGAVIGAATAEGIGGAGGLTVVH